MSKYLFIAFFAVNSLFALDLDNLLKDIRNDASQQLQNEQKRLQEFRQNTNKQNQLLKEAKATLKSESNKSERLKSKLDKNEALLTEQETLLAQKMGDLGEMFGSVRQTAADFSTNFQNSLTASQAPMKKELFAQFANSKKLPNIKELENLWHGMLEEIVRSGNVETYNAEVILRNGDKSSQEVTRVGLFSAKSEGKYFNYSNDMEALVELSTQPANLLSNSKTNFVIDPTRGTLFELLNNQPTLMNRIQQGGVVGYIIIFLGAIGLLFALFKIIALNITFMKIKKQMKNLANPTTNNPLGKVVKVFEEYKNHNINDLEVKMGETILKETNSVKKGQSLVKLLSAVTPLLGLLGTVTGMIATFQAITLFGTGDPKLMAGGISTALMTTVLGLVAAIPLLFAYTYIASKSGRIVSVLEEQGMGMLAKSLK